MLLVGKNYTLELDPLSNGALSASQSYSFDLGRFGLGQPLVHYLDPVASSFQGHLHMMISDPARQINLWPSIFWVMLLCGSLRWHTSSIERQRLYFLLVGMIGFASIVYYAIWHPAVKQLGVWKILNAGGFGLTLIALGLYDYVVLVRALPKRVAEGRDE